MYNENYYEILGLSEDATDQDIKKSYRSLVKKFHPDINSKTGSEEIFMIIQEAYEVLVDPSLREKYDEILSRKYDNEDYEEYEDDSSPGYKEEEYSKVRRSPVKDYQTYTYTTTYKTNRSYLNINFISIIRWIIAVVFLIFLPASYIYDTGNWNQLILYYGWVILFNIFSKLIYLLTFTGLFIWFIVSLVQKNGKNVLMAIGTYLLVSLVFWILFPNTFSDI